MDAATLWSNGAMEQCTSECHAACSHCFLLLLLARNVCGAWTNTGAACYARAHACHTRAHACHTRAHACHTRATGQGRGGPGLEDAGARGPLGIVLERKDVL
jgi:hypothetical protein